MDDVMVERYLTRIGAARPARPDLAGLRHLQERQLLTVPFEDLGYHLDEDVPLDDGVLDKIVTRHRGGGCYEVNPALGLLLRALGYEVEVLPGRVYREDRLGPPFCHLVLRVRLDGEDWLVDTGFGRNSRFPLRFAEPGPQADPHGEYTLSATGDGTVDVALGGRPLYQVDTRPARMDDFRPTLWWWRTCPDSPFLQDVFCTMATPDGRTTLRGSRLTRVEGGERTTEDLADDHAVRTAYKEHFGIELDRLPGPVAVRRETTGLVGVQLS